MALPMYLRSVLLLSMDPVLACWNPSHCSSIVSRRKVRGREILFYWLIYPPNILRDWPHISSCAAYNAWKLSRVGTRLPSFYRPLIFLLQKEPIKTRRHNPRGNIGRCDTQIHPLWYWDVRTHTAAGVWVPKPKKEKKVRGEQDETTRHTQETETQGGWTKERKKKSEMRKFRRSSRGERKRSISWSDWRRRTSSTQINSNAFHRRNTHQRVHFQNGASHLPYQHVYSNAFIISQTFYLFNTLISSVATFNSNAPLYSELKVKKRPVDSLVHAHCWLLLRWRPSRPFLLQFQSLWPLHTKFGRPSHANFRFDRRRSLKHPWWGHFFCFQIERHFFSFSWPAVRF